MELLQTIVWTALPKDVRGDRLLLSVFVSPRLDVKAAPGETPQLGMDNFPDFQDWPATASGKNFSVDFYDDGVVDDGAPDVRPKFPGEADPQLITFSPDPAGKLRVTKVAPPRQASASADWRALLQGLSTGKFIFRDYAGKIITYSYATLAELLKSHYQPAVWQLAANPEVAEHLDLVTHPPQNSFDDYQAMLKSLHMAEEEEADLFDAISRRMAEGRLFDVEQPPDCFSKAQWHWGLLRYTFHMQRTATSSEHARCKDLPNPEIDFHSMISSLGQYPQLLREFGLVIDLELTHDSNDPAAAARWAEVAGKNIVRVRGEWQPADGKVDAFPWTKFRLTTDRFVARPRARNSELAEGMLNLKHKVGEKSSYFVTQVDVVANAPNLRPQRPADDSLTLPGIKQLPPLRSTGVALSWSGLGQKVDEKLTEARKSNAELSAGSKEKLKERRLFAEDVVRGYRIDVQPQNGAWFSLCRRSGVYEFAGQADRPVIEDEGWISIPGLKARDGITVQESMFWWSGWSLCVNRPEDTPADSCQSGATGLPQSLQVKFDVIRGSLPRLRFGQAYRMRARLVDMAGNGLAFNDARAAANEALLSDAFTYGRFEPVVAPRLLPRKSLEGLHGETLDRVVIRTSNLSSPAATTERSERHIVPPQVSELMAETHGRFDPAIKFEPDDTQKAHQKELQQQAYEKIRTREGRLEENFYDVDTIQLPYLPDPLAVGVILKGLPGTQGPRVIPFTPNKNLWPSAQPMRLKLASTAANSTQSPAPIWNEARRELTVFLPRGETAEVEVRSVLDSDDLKLMTLWMWAREEGEDKARLVEDAVTSGCHGMFTPCRKFTLVHATRQPVFEPCAPGQRETPPSLSPDRKEHETFVHLVGSVEVPGRSADKLELIGTWVEWLDDALPNSTPREFKKTSRAFEVTLEQKDSVLRFVPEPAAGVEPGGNLGRHEFGDTRHRMVEYTAAAATRFRDCFPPETENLTKNSKTFTVNVPNCARPPAPDIFYVIPIFGQTSVTRSANTVTGRKQGGGLRVYLRRPWFVSGDEERLGVLLFPGRLADARPEHMQYITQWGKDTVWDKDTVGQLTPANFTSSLQPEQVTLPEISNQPLLVVPHAVAPFNNVRNLWYSDITLGGVTSHMPFIRLALVRYQKHSISGAGLSKVTLADFAQLTPTRTASIVRSAGGAVTVSLAREESLYQSTEGGANFPPVVVASVESRPRAAATDLTWEELASVTLADGGGAWTGQLTPPPLAADKEYRFVFREYETYRADDEFMEENRRLIYADAFEWRD